MLLDAQSVLTPERGVWSVPGLKGGGSLFLGKFLCMVLNSAELFGFVANCGTEVGRALLCGGMG